MPVQSVNFYLLNEQTTISREIAVCHLVEQYYLNGQRVFIWCDNEEQAHTVDELLWTFNNTSFIPHNLEGEGPDFPPPIQIGYKLKPRPFFNDVLLLLSTNIPSFHTQFREIIELMPPDEKTKTKGRIRYKQYKALKYQLNIKEYSNPLSE